MHAHWLPSNSLVGVAKGNTHRSANLLPLPLLPLPIPLFFIYGLADADACCFIPVQRIYARCAYAEIPVQYPIENGTQLETVFIACPIPLKYSA